MLVCAALEDTVCDAFQKEQAAVFACALELDVVLRAGTYVSAQDLLNLCCSIVSRLPSVQPGDRGRLGGVLDELNKPNSAYSVHPKPHQVYL